jgi:AcrR family transcriptional regulator
MSDLANGRTAEAQAFRAERVIRAAADLATAGGYEAVQMREIARVAGVSLATLYRYYSSKDDLILAAAAGEMQKLRRNVNQHPPRERTAHGRAAAVFIRAFRALERNRGMAHATICCYIVPLALDSEPRPVVDTWFIDIAAHAAWGPGRRTKEQVTALQVLQTMFPSIVARWLNGQISSSDVEETFRFTAKRLLEPCTP